MSEASARAASALIEGTPLTPFMGLRVEGVSLAHATDDASIAAIGQALAEHSLLLFPAQHDMDPESQIAFSRCLGPLEEHVLADFCLPGHPEIFVVSNIIENGRHIGAYGGSKQYHSDLAYLPEPSMGSVFRCLECPEEGGETAFVSMFAVHDALPEERRRWLAGRRIVYDYAWDYERRHTQRPPLTEAQKQRVPPISQPCVRKHPVTGRLSLNVGPTWARRFEDMDEQSSRPILDELNALSAEPRFSYTHRWTPGDVLVWDNRSTMHKACPFDETGTRRLMHRTTIRGDRPLGPAD